MVVVKYDNDVRKCESRITTHHNHSNGNKIMIGFPTTMGNYYVNLRYL